MCNTYNGTNTAQCANYTNYTNGSPWTVLWTWLFGGAGNCQRVCRDSCGNLHVHNLTPTGCCVALCTQTATTQNTTADAGFGCCANTTATPTTPTNGCTNWPIRICGCYGYSI